MNKPNPIAILVGDIHLRESQPIARMDDFWGYQWEVLSWLSSLQKKYECEVWCSGDVFDHWKASPFLLSKAIQYLPDRFFTVYGNHDLPYHGLENKEKSALNVLAECGKVKIFKNFHWGESPDDSSDQNICVWHVETWHQSTPYPNCSSMNALELLRKYKQFQLILTGHNHIPFTVQYEKRWLINPGSLTQQNANETHSPRVYLWYGNSITPEPVFIPYTEKVKLTRAHLESKEKRDERINMFISHLNDNWEINMDFKYNLEQFFSMNQTRESVKQIISKAMDHEIR